MKKLKDNGMAPGGKAPVARQQEAPPVTIPLGSVRHGRLLFPAGAGRLELNADTALPGLCEARFKRYQPRIWVQDGIVTVHCGRLSLAGTPLTQGTMQLNGSVPWEIEIRKGISYLEGHLAQLHLQSLDILGGASHLRLRLSRPASTTFIYLAGGITQGSIRVPGTVELRLRLRGGVTKLTFDGQHFGTVRGETSFQSAGYAGATSRYDIFIGGGASHLAVTRQG